MDFVVPPRNTDTNSSCTGAEDRNISGPVPIQLIGNVFLHYLLPRLQRALKQLLGATLYPHHTAAEFIGVFRLQNPGRSVLPRVDDELQIRAGVGTRATLISAGKVLDTRCLRQTCTFNSVVSWTYIPINVDRMPSRPSGR